MNTQGQEVRPGPVAGGLPCVMPLKGPQGNMSTTSRGKTPKRIPISACAVDGELVVLGLAPSQP